MFPHAKKFIYNTLQFNNDSKLTTALNTFIIILILLSVPIDVLESVKDVPPYIKRITYHTDLFISLVFALEYALRVITCTQDPQYARPIAGCAQDRIAPRLTKRHETALRRHASRYSFIKPFRQPPSVGQDCAVCRECPL